MAVESEPLSKILEARSDVFIAAMEDMIHDDLDPRRIIELENSNPDEFRGFAQVALGLKPMATSLLHVMDCFWRFPDQSDGKNPNPQEPYIYRFANGSGVKPLIITYPENYTTWNPDMVNHVLQSNRPLVDTISYPYDPFEIIHNPPKFAQFQRFLRRGYPKELFVLNGLLHGYPAVASEAFWMHVYPLYEMAEVLWHRAAQERIKLRQAKPPKNLQELIRNIDMYRDDLIVLTRHFNPDQDVLNYLRDMEYADIPGTDYITSGYTTFVNEAQQRHLWALSQLDDKLERFFEKIKKQ